MFELEQLESQYNEVVYNTASLPVRAVLLSFDLKNL